MTDTTNLNEWQLCPKCLGQGYLFFAISSGPSDCDLCNGTKIISRQTGRPPEEAVIVTYKNMEVSEPYPDGEDYDI